MLFKGASQCCTPVSVKRPSLPRSLPLSSSLYACEAHQSHTMVRCDVCVPASKKIAIIQFSVIWCSCVYVSIFEVQTCAVGSADFMLFITVQLLKRVMIKAAR